MKFITLQRAFRLRNHVLEIVDHVANGGRIIFCDCLANGNYLKAEL
jgi:hypothetical protein